MHLLARRPQLRLLAEHVGVDAHHGGAEGERGIGGQHVLDRAHQRRLAGARGADEQDVADAQAGQLLGQGDRDLAHRVGLAEHALAERGRDLGRATESRAAAGEGGAEGGGRRRGAHRVDCMAADGRRYRALPAHHRRAVPRLVSVVEPDLRPQPLREREHGGAAMPGQPGRVGQLGRAEEVEDERPARRPPRPPSGSDRTAARTGGSASRRRSRRRPRRTSSPGGARNRR